MSDTVPPEVEERITAKPTMAHVATCVDGRPHVAPVWYHYDDGALELLTTGKKLENVRRNPRVAVSIQEDDAGEAKWRVTLLGTATVVDDDEETAAAARRINPKYGAEPDAWSGNTLVRIDIGTTTYESY
ncbi:MULTISPECIES: pyridoxamine 5'-phosphate oxidase family protein [Haloprofundus]|uniref:pyridoxamine 5'-phosphate oxidase family protein n=1 Tax=Haloprofundus TaxID=1911573 RepID=UPI000E435A47|nr:MULTISPECIES: pyridoxamine 5'-phosphate oxidase family protein [Haloprofundus]QCJ46294.1 pyridoxamine 5'-phosphate oxidase family protein [Haloprofundus sp. MHR1]